ncbi:WD40/YVTN/BNR-like repeat-containing protein [Candidatus Epulonipiscium viviparus]|uniref:WD40/YVTN/BNR-like repeat-containing protein n=1 Tax=Candidatus Epulonipiscium viviparus TaxID=420336 RepID=UPI00016C0B50|nr:hypothetical protein [Candidatus Epulopiscium viviparus]
MERIDYKNQVSCPGAAVAFHPHDHNTVYAVVDRLNHRGQFVRSTTGGTDWECLCQLFDVPMSDAIKAYTLIIDKNNPTTMYFALPSKAINAVAFSNDHHTIYSAAMGADGGLYKSTDEARNWIKMPLPPGVNSINDVSVTPKGRLIISTGFASATASECAGGMYYSADEGVSWTLAFMWASSYASGFYKLILPDGFSSANKIMTTEDYDIKGLPIEALLK